MMMFETKYKTIIFSMSKYKTPLLRFETSTATSSLVSNLIGKSETENKWFSCKHMIEPSMVRFNFLPMVWDFGLANIVGFGFSVYAVFSVCRGDAA